jgi:prepilin peptidase CpaA
MTLSAAAIALLLWAALSDLAHRRIPNGIVAALALLALIRMGSGAASSWDWTLLADLAAGLGVFAAGAAAFQLGLLGGGDVKLLAAGALWAGASALWPFLFLTALAGGLLALGFALAIGAARLRAARDWRPTLPYGVAIAAGGILVTASGL